MKEPIPGFDCYWMEMRAHALNTPLEVEGIKQMLELEPGARIFDAGCGPGRIANPLAKEGFEVVGVDLSLEMIEGALARAVVEDSGAVFIPGDYLDVPLEELGGPFDAVLSWHTSWGYDTHERNIAFLKKACEMLKPGGKLLLQTWNPLGLPEQTVNVHRASDGALICEILDFDPFALTINIERAVFDSVVGSKRERATCHVYTARDIYTYSMEAGFDDVLPMSIPLDHPWQAFIISRSVPS